MASAPRVVFGRPWAVALPEVLPTSRVGILCSPGRKPLADSIASALAGCQTIVVDRAKRHVPRAIVVEAAAILGEHETESIVAVGGGSAIGLAKAVQLEAKRFFVAVPTTYSGSEMTDIYGIREGERKRVGRDPRARADVVVYDRDLTLDLPLSLSLPSLFNAMAHAVDALYVAPSQQTITTASDSIHALSAAIAELAERPRDPDARSHAMWGAHLAGGILSEAQMALHHKLAHVVGGTFDLPHAETHTVLLPHVVAFNARHAPNATRVIAEALYTDDPAGALYDLARRVGAPTDLASLGFEEGDIATAAEQLCSASFPNPHHPSREEAVALLSAARAGTRPVLETRS